ncbi:15477_t:CDS:2, partial [Entrophospora sp. SA101]
MDLVGIYQGYEFLSHENSFDHKDTTKKTRKDLLKLATYARDGSFLIWQDAHKDVQTSFDKILQYLVEIRTWGIHLLGQMEGHQGLHIKVFGMRQAKYTTKKTRKDLLKLATYARDGSFLIWQDAHKDVQTSFDKILQYLVEIRTWGIHLLGQMEGHQGLHIKVFGMRQAKCGLFLLSKLDSFPLPNEESLIDFRCITKPIETMIRLAKEVVHAITNFHKNEEEMMIVCEEDEEIQFLTKNSKDDNNEASTTSDNFSSTNEIKRSSPANSATDTASTSSTETTARSIQNLQVQGQGLEEELSVLDDEDGIITSGRREWT